MKFQDRYAGALRTKDLRSNASSTHSASDVVGAAGLTAREYPASIELLRFFAGDNRGAPKVVSYLADVISGRAYRTGAQMTRVEAEDMARSILAWYRDGRCPACSGRGFGAIEGAPMLSGKACPACHGARRVAFEGAFDAGRLELATWLRARVERELALGAADAKRRLGPGEPK